MYFARKFALGLAVVLFVSSLLSCGFLPLFGDMLGMFGQRVSFDLSGARAIGGANASGGRALLSGAKNASNNALVKILENGDIESIISLGGLNPWMPDVAFISVGADESIYVCFTGSMNTVNGFAQFVRVYNEPGYPFDVIWPPAGSDYDAGSVNVWNWWGFDTDPLAKGDDGKLYFRVSRQNGMFQEDILYCYDPLSGSDAVPVTPENANLNIASFLVDAKGHVFIQSTGGYDGSQAAFLRYYTPGVTAPMNIYYSSTSDIWVRGYVSDPRGDFLVVNGCNVPGGGTGILKANIVSASQVTYETLYDGSAGSSFSNVGRMVWMSDGSLYGLYDNYWWGSTSNATGAVRILDSNGAPIPREVTFTHGGAERPTRIRIVGDWIYYRYAILDAGQETGKHRLARFNLLTKTTEADQEILGVPVPESEILAYDVADDNSLLYFVAYELETNSIFGGKVDLGTGVFSRFEMATKINNIRIVH